jgi:hypothetical protein
MRLRHLVPLVVFVTLVVPVGANASTLLDRNARGVTLKVDSKGQAVVSYTARGKKWNVLAWGAVNAIAPSAGNRQVDFKLDYSGGWGTYKKDVWKTVRNTCGTYNGPPLAWRVTSCTAKDGSNWAIQSWQRMLPNYGVAPNATQAVWELRLSHWTGQLPELTVNTNWAYHKYDHLFGTFFYNGAPVHGFRSTAGGNPLDTFGRNLYVDTFNSSYGRGWKRENSFLMHKGTGTFCYGFYPHGSHPVGKGERYRATIIGPGVTPDVMWQGNAPGAYDPSLDQQLADEQRQIFASDHLCKAV